MASYPSISGAGFALLKFTFHLLRYANVDVYSRLERLKKGEEMREFFDELCCFFGQV